MAESPAHKWGQIIGDFLEEIMVGLLTYSAKAAIDYLQSYSYASEAIPIYKYEIQVVYNNGDKINGVFENVEQAVTFLSSYLPPKPVAS